MRSLKILIPNMLTGFRLFATVGIFWLVWNSDISLGTLNNYQIAGIILFVALITDLIDGPIARKLQAITRFGYFFDHIVDYVLFVPMIYLILQHLWLYLGVYFLVFQIGAVLISFIRLVIKDKTLWPNNFGRTSYGFLGASVCVLLFFFSSGLWQYFFFLANILLGIATTLRLISLLVFYKDFRKEVKENA